MKTQDKSTGSCRKVPLTLFVVEDNEMYLMALSYYLRRFSSFTLHCFRSGEECLQNLSLNPDVVVLDYNLDEQNPGAMNGPDTLKKIKQLSPSTEVILLSGQFNLSNALETLKNGAFTYIQKNNASFASLQKTIEYIRSKKQPQCWEQTE